MRRFTTTDGRPVWVVIVPGVGMLDVFSTRKRAQAHADSLIRGGVAALLIRTIIRKD